MYLHVIWISIIFFMLYRKIIPCVIQDLTDNYNESASFAFQSPQSFVYCVLRFISFVLIQKFYMYTRKEIPPPLPQSLRLTLLSFIFNKGFLITVSSSICEDVTHLVSFCCKVHTPCFNLHVKTPFFVLHVTNHPYTCTSIYNFTRLVTSYMQEPYPSHLISFYMQGTHSSILALFYL